MRSALLLCLLSDAVNAANSEASNGLPFLRSLLGQHFIKHALAPVVPASAQQSAHKSTYLATSAVVQSQSAALLQSPQTPKTMTSEIAPVTEQTGAVSWLKGSQSPIATAPSVPSAPLPDPQLLSAEKRTEMSVLTMLAKGVQKVAEIAQSSAKREAELKVQLDQIQQTQFTMQVLLNKTGTNDLRAFDHLEDASQNSTLILAHLQEFALQTGRSDASTLARLDRSLSAKVDHLTHALVQRENPTRDYELSTQQIPPLHLPDTRSVPYADAGYIASANDMAQSTYGISTANLGQTPLAMPWGASDTVPASGAAWRLTSAQPATGNWEGPLQAIDNNTAPGYASTWWSSSGGGYLAQSSGDATAPTVPPAQPLVQRFASYFTQPSSGAPQALPNNALSWHERLFGSSMPTPSKAPMPLQNTENQEGALMAQLAGLTESSSPDALNEEAQLLHQEESLLRTRIARSSSFLATDMADA